MSLPLRHRLLLGVVGTLLVGLAATALLNYFAVRRALYGEFDGLLAAKARALATLVEQHGDRVTLGFVERPMQEFTRLIRPEYYEVWDSDQTVLARSRRLASGELANRGGALAAPKFGFVTLPDGRSGRQAGIIFLPAMNGESLDVRSNHRGDDAEDARDQVGFSRRRHITLVVAKDTDEIIRTLRGMAWRFAGISAGAVTAMLGALAFVIRRCLWPLDALASQIGRLDEQRLFEAISLSNPRAELAPVVARLNELLARLAEAFQRERMLTANLAHELRTPLSGLRSTLDVALGRTRDAGEYRRALESCHAICQDTQELTETLMTLARIDAGRAVVDRSFVDVGHAVEQAWSNCSKRSFARGLRATFAGPADTFLDTDATMFRVVLTNLFDNAVEYADEGGFVACDWAASEQGLTLNVVNSGCRLGAEQCCQVFDRFWRADAARCHGGPCRAWPELVPEDCHDPRRLARG